ncbi:MAG: hypothetical protein ACI4EG_15065 [Fusicatenibacter sp.]|nr:hypothetical protein [Fusicatenibacter sp.]
MNGSYFFKPYNERQGTIDFAIQAADRALLMSMEAIEAQMIQEDRMGGDTK